MINNPFRTKYYQEQLKNSNKLTKNEFLVVTSDETGIYIRLTEINELIKCGALKIDHDKLEQRIYDKTVMKL